MRSRLIRAASIYAGIAMMAPPCLSAALAIEEIGEPASLEALAPEWSELGERCPQLHCFQRPEWLLPWVRHFYRGEKIWALAIRREDRLVGFAPLFIHRHHRDFRVRQVSFIGAGITDYLDVLCEPEIAEEVTAAVFRYLQEHRDRWDICDLQELPGTSPVLSAALPDGLCSAWLPCGICPVLSLPATQAEFEESLRGRFKNLRRTMHRLQRDPGIEIASAGESSYGEYLGELFRLHGERWKERRESGMFANPDIRGFHSEVAAGFAQRGLLRASRLSCEGQTVSVWYGFASRGRCYAYLTGFDPEFARLSPGQVLLAYSMEMAIAEGARVYDFLRKTEEFKHRWGAVDFPNRRLIAWHSESRLPGPDFLEQAQAELKGG